MRKRMIRIREVSNGFIVDQASHTDQMSSDDCVFQSMSELLSYISCIFEYRQDEMIENDLDIPS